MLGTFGLHYPRVSFPCLPFLIFNFRIYLFSFMSSSFSMIFYLVSAIIFFHMFLYDCRCSLPLRPATKLMLSYIIIYLDYDTGLAWELV